MSGDSAKPTLAQRAAQLAADLTAFANLPGISLTAGSGDEQSREAAGAPQWFEDYRDGEILTTQLAAHILDVTPQAILTQCRAADDVGIPIGIRVSEKLWLVSKRRLLESITDPSERLKARGRAEKMQKLGPAQEIRLGK